MTGRLKVRYACDSFGPGCYKFVTLGPRPSPRRAMAFRLFPRDDQFFDLFNQMADEIKASAGMLEAMLSADPPDLSKVDLIKDAEHRCDALTHDTIQRLHRTFVTPFDREDLYALASALDDVMDAIDHVAAL